MIGKTINWFELIKNSMTTFTGCHGAKEKIKKENQLCVIINLIIF